MKHLQRNKAELPSVLQFQNYRLLSTALRQDGRYEKAIAEYKKALEVEPNDIFTHFGLAVAYIELDREHESKTKCKKS